TPDDEDSEEEIEKIVETGIFGKGFARRKMYRVRWKGFGPEYDTWFTKENLSNAAELVAEYDAAHRRKYKKRRIY
ncbi:hypothetical protein RUND412_005119, partial [Rhizina undulata]